MKLKPGTLFFQNVPGKTGKEQPPLNTGKPSPLKPIQTAQPLLKQTPAQTLTSASLVKAAAALGLPQDALSSALLAFARFFAITPRQELLANLRREVLVLLSAKKAGDKTGLKAKYIEAKGLEAKALAVLAAFDKGVRLESDFLEEQPPREFNSNLPDAEDLRQSFDEDNEKEDVLGFLNRIPGKNNQRWMVWPFNYNDGDIELKVLIQVLLKEPMVSFIKSEKAGESPSPVSGAAWLIVDISGPKRNWRFLLNKKEGKIENENLSIDIGIKPGLSAMDIKKLKKDFKDLGFSDIRIRNNEDLSLVQEPGFGDLYSVNKEV